MRPSTLRDRLKSAQANARRDWYRIQNAAGDGESSGPAQVYIYGEIGDSFWSESVPASQFVREFSAIDADEIDLHIHSPGGSAFDGLAIATAIRTHAAKTTAYVDGLAASAASYIAIAADETVMAVGSEYMIHEAAGIALGDAAEMTKMAEVLNGLSDNIASLYALKAGGSASDWRDAMREETWYNADEAVAAGLADRVDRQAEPVKDEATNHFDLTIFAHAGRQDAPAPRFPGRARAQASGRAGGTTQPQEGADSMSDLIKGLRDRLGIPADAEVDDGAILAAVDEALAERAEPTAQVPAGTTLIDSAVLAELQANAREGAAARAEQVTAARAALVDSAIRDGRTTPARRDHWLASLAADPDGTAQVLAALPKGLMLPVGEPAGYTGGLEASADDDRVSAAARAAGWES